MKFVDLLKQLKKYLETERFLTHYALGKEEAEYNEVLIGIGKESLGGVLLNNKVDGIISVSQFIVQQSEEVIEIWRGCLSYPEKPEICSYYIEDFSADTCLAFILFVSRILRVSENELPHGWLTYTNRWKNGDVRTTGEPFGSWGALLNALSHDYYEYEAEGKRYNQEKIQDGFRACLLFTIDLLLGEHSPSKVPFLHESEAYHRATAILNIENQEYQSVLNSAEKIQLELPLRYSNRRVLVDCLIVTEINPLGTLKNFSRTDLENPFFKSGYGLMVLHRPYLSGTGDDIAISVDPVTGTHLHDLWIQLEALEDARWNGKRPTDPPRKGYTVNQPWFDGYGSTLIAAPRYITVRDEQDPNKSIITEQLGSKLNWDDVLKLLWELYNPIKNVTVHPYENGKWNLNKSLHICDTAIKNNGEKKFLALKWASKNNNVIVTPTFQRYLVACLIGKKEATIGLGNLPSETSFKVFDIPGGFALIHEEGVVFFDDWTKDDSKIEQYMQEFNILGNRYKALLDLKNRIGIQTRDLMTKLDKKKEIRKGFIPLSDKLAKLKMELRSTVLDTMSTSKDLHLSLFRAEIEKRWGLNTQLEELHQSVTEIENTIKNIVDTRTNRVLNLITIYGFPVALFGGIFQDSLAEIFVKGELDGTGIFFFLVFTGLVMAWIKNIIDKK